MTDNSPNNAKQTIANTIVQKAHNLSQLSSTIVDELGDKLFSVMLEQKKTIEKSNPEPIAVEPFPPLFEELRHSLTQIEMSLSQIQNMIDRTEL